MAEAKMKLTVETAEYRPCYVDGKKALFHRWTDVPFLSPSKVCWGLSEDEATDYHALAIVEYEDGTVYRVFPEQVRFVPGLMNEYDFEEAVMNETGDATD